MRPSLALLVLFVVRVDVAIGADQGLQERDPQRGASPAGQSALDELIVTARRRAERELDVPVAMAAIGRSEIAAAEINSLDRLQRLVPSLHVFGFNPRLTSISIRSLGGNVGLTSDGLEGGVGVFVDDVYLARVGTTVFGLSDIERIEVLRGPQGTLFGRNTTAGAISIVTAAPRLDAVERTLKLSSGDYGFREFEGLISGPLRAGAVAGRLTLMDKRRDGYTTNVHTGESVQNLDESLLRGQLSFAPSSQLRVRLTADYGSQKQRCCSSATVGVMRQLDDGSPVANGYLDRVARLNYVPLPFDPFARNVDTDAAVRADMRQRGVAARVDWALESLDLTSITAFRDWDWNPASDFDDTPFPAVTMSQTANRQRQSSQELRVATRGRARADFVAGFYHFDEDVDGLGLFGYGPSATAWFFPATTAAQGVINDAALNGFTSQATSWATTRSNALFGQTNLHLTERLDVSLGLRYTAESRHGGFVQETIAGQDLAALPPADAAAAHAIRERFNAETEYAAAVDDDGLTGNVTLSWRAAPAALAYVTAARGRKAGGLNIGNFPSGFDPAIRPDTAHHYEAGLKGSLLDGSLLLGVALYRTTVNDYQTSLLQTNASGSRLLQYISNVDEVTSQGGELDVAWAATERLAVSIALARADAEYASFPNGPCPPEVSLTPAACDLSGQPLAGAPKRSATLAFDGSLPLASSHELHWHVDYSRRSDVLTAVSNSRYSRVEGFGLATLRLGIRRRDARWDIVTWVRNALDEEYFQLISARSTGLIAGLTGEPRTVGLTFTGSF